MHEEEEKEEERGRTKYRTEHKCADEATVRIKRLTEIQKRIKKAIEKRAILRGKSGDLTQEMDRMGDKIEKDAEIARNIAGSLEVLNKEFERYWKIRDRNGEI